MKAYIVIIKSTHVNNIIAYLMKIRCNYRVQEDTNLSIKTLAYERVYKNNDTSTLYLKIQYRSSCALDYTIANEK